MESGRIPILYFDVSKDNREAIGDLADADVNCKFKGPSGDVKTPILIFESKRYIGKNGIKLFIQEYKK